jgi:hypothetical protein
MLACLEVHCWHSCLGPAHHQVLWTQWVAFCPWASC